MRDINTPGHALSRTPDYDVDVATRAHMRNTLAQYAFPELGCDRPQPRFSTARYLRRLAANLPIDGYEGELLRAAASGEGQRVDFNRGLLPWGVFADRAMGATPGSKGGYLTSGEVVEPVDVLRGWSVTAEAGIQIVSGLTSGSLTVPTTATSSTGSWIRELEASTESPPTLGGVSLSPKTGICLAKFSLQFLHQAAAADSYVPNMLKNAVGRTLLDAAVLAGAGGAEPLGLTGTSGVGTQSGSSLARAGLLAMERQCLAAGARDDRLTWIAAPATAELLAGREAVSTAGRFLLEDGKILGKPVHVSLQAPTGRLICGDFSTALIAIWGRGVTLETDPSQDFARGGLVARILMFCDVGFPNPGAFCVSSTVT